MNHSTESGRRGLYKFKESRRSSHQLLIHLVSSLQSTGRQILDIGPFDGALMRNMTGSIEYARKLAIELSTEHLDELREVFDEVIVADLSTIAKLPQESDAIILADVLEHMPDPPQLLDRCLAGLAPEGRLFISVPNVANIVNRFGLLIGRFDYTDRGLLDRTHLRFYTRKSFLRLLADSDLDVSAIETSSMPIRMVLERRLPGIVISLLERILDGVTSLFPTLFGYQFVVAAQRKTVRNH